MPFIVNFTSYIDALSDGHWWDYVNQADFSLFLSYLCFTLQIYVFFLHNILFHKNTIPVIH